MKDSHGCLRAICLAGPTGSGKTALGVKLAKIWDCEIINADSRQLYRDFPIITAQPSREETGQIPHHLYGILPLDKKCSAAEWTRLACEKIGEIRSRGKTPLLIGGTGFYIKALFEGLSEIPTVSPAVSAEIAERMAKAGSISLYAELSGVDPETARRIHPNDRQRIGRALEVYYSTGKTLYWWQKHAGREPACAGSIFWLKKSLAALEPALHERILLMLKNGALEEVEEALANFPDLSLSGWDSIGARELASYLKKEAGLEESVNRWFDSTRAYAKRQLTWFRGQKNWIDFTDAGALLDYARTQPFPSNFSDQP